MHNSRLITALLFGTTVLTASARAQVQSTPTTPAPATPAQAMPTDLAEPLPPQMTGSIEQRNSLIEKILAGNDQSRVVEIHFNQIDLNTALRYLSMQTKIDILLPADDLKQQGVELGTVTLNLYDATFVQVLEAIRWQLGLKSGGVVWKALDGVLTLVHVADAPRATETNAQRKQDAALAALLKQPMPVDLLKKPDTPPGVANGTVPPNPAKDRPISAADLLQMLSMAIHANIVMDANGLIKAGLDINAPVITAPNDPTGEDMLKAALTAMKGKDGTAASYEIWAGILHISTRQRLDNEMPKLDKPGTGLP